MVYIYIYIITLIVSYGVVINFINLDLLSMSKFKTIESFFKRKRS